MKRMLYIIFFILMMTAVLGAECDWNVTEVRNCNVTTNITITGNHNIANVSLQNNVYVDLSSTLLTYNDSWGYKPNNVSVNNMFLISGHNVTIDGNDNSVIKGKYGGACNVNYGTTAFNIDFPSKNYPVVKNIKFEEHLADFRFQRAVYGIIDSNVINHTDTCHPTIFGTGNHTNLTNNDWKGSIEVFGGETNIVGNRLLDEVDDNCDGLLFRITNTAGWETNPSWYGKVTDNDFGIDCFGWDKNFDIQFYSGDGFNISNNKNLKVEWNIPSTGNESIYNNTNILFYFVTKPEEIPTICVDGVYNGWAQLGIYHEGNWKVSDWVCAGDTELKDISLTIQTSNVSLNCDGIAINDLDNNGFQPLQIWGDSWANGAQDNVSVENCNLWNSYGNAMSIQVGDAFNITNIRLKDIETISTAESIYLWGVNGLYVDNMTGTDCGAGFSIFEGIEFGVDGSITNNVTINNSNFTGGGCKGYGSTFQGLNSGLTIENSVFDTREAEVNTLSAFYTTGVNIHNNKFLGRSTALNALSGVFYDNIVDDLMIGVSNNLDICNGGIGNTLNQLSIWNIEGVNVLLDSACNPLIIPNGISIRNYDTINSTITLNGNGVTLTGSGLVGINISGTDENITIVDSTIQNIDVSGFNKSILLNEFTKNNLLKDMIVTTAYEDNGVSNTFTNVSLFCFENWQPYYTLCSVGDNQTLYYLDSSMCGTYDDLPIDNSTISYCNYCSIAYHSVESACVNSQKTTSYVYDNYGSCCALTGIPADCNLPANTIEACSLFVHQPSDIIGVITDFGVEYGMTLISVVGIIVIVVVFAYIGFIL